MNRKGFTHKLHSSQKNYHNHVITTNDITPMVIHLPPRNMGIALVNFNGQVQQVAQFGFPFNTLHSTNVLSMPVNERKNFRLFPTVMPNVSGFCYWCGRTFDHVALETLGDYLSATAYNEATVREHAVWSRAFTMDSRSRCSSLKMQDCCGHRDAMGPECTNKKINNTCNKTLDVKNSFISLFNFFICKHFVIARVINSFHLIKLVL